MKLKSQIESLEAEKTKTESKFFELEKNSKIREGELEKQIEAHHVNDAVVRIAEEKENFYKLEIQKLEESNAKFLMQINQTSQEKDQLINQIENLNQEIQNLNFEFETKVIESNQSLVSH